MARQNPSANPIAFDALEAIPMQRDAAKAQQRTLLRRQRMEKQVAMRREQLLDAAFDLFRDVGLQGFNMRELGLRAGYTPGALYVYFDGKAAILQALRERMLGQLAAELQRPENRRRKGVRERATGPTGDTTESAEQPMQDFLRLSRVWWQWLAEDMLRLRLLLAVDHPVQVRVTRKTGPIEPLQVPSGLQGRLAAACGPCLDCLLGSGVPEDVARRMHDDAVIWGVGLLVLNAELAGSVELQNRFLFGIEQRLIETGLVVNGAEAGGGQQDLFGR